MEESKGKAAKTAERQEWTIPRCTQRWIRTDLQSEDWPGYCERLMGRSEMQAALKECTEKWEPARILAKPSHFDTSIRCRDEF